ncbi:unnamed protein product, partial [Cuscuta campestris]
IKDEGENGPVLTFSNDDIQQFSSKYKYGVTGRMAKVIHNIDIAESLKRANFGGFRISSLTRFQVLIVFSEEEDYYRLLTRRSWKVLDGRLYLSKWSPSYLQSKESPLFPIWATIKQIPIHLQDPRALLPITRLIGIPIKMDERTVQAEYLNTARVLVEVDLSKQLPSKIKVRIGETIYFFPVSFQDVPIFCSKCSRFGHSCYTGKIPSNEPTGKILTGGNFQTGGNGCLDHSKHQETKGKWVLVEHKKKAPKVGRTSFQNGGSCTNIIMPKPCTTLQLETADHVDSSKAHAAGTSQVLSPVPTLRPSPTHSLAPSLVIVTDPISPLEDHFLKKYMHKGSKDDMAVSKGNRASDEFLQQVLGLKESKLEDINEITTHSDLDEHEVMDQSPLEPFELNTPKPGSPGLLITRGGGSGSDHKPILLKGAINSYKGPKMFRFLNCWVSNDTFIPMVKLNWEKSSNVNGMSGFAEKLKILKTAIKEWNVSTFGDIFKNVKMAEEEALARQNSFDNNPTEDNRAAANLASAKLLNACKREASYWFQKSNIKWMKEGDSNSKFFHSVVKGKRAKLKITAIKDEEGVNHIDNNKIATLAVEHFTKLFEESPCKASEETLRYIPCTVTAEDNNSLKKLPSMEEVKQAVWSLNENAAPGPDGFNGFFFRACWDIIKIDLLKACQEFFLGVKVPVAFASTIITLIPKVNSPIKWKDFRPISLSTFMSKINSRILATRLSIVINKVIGPEQAGFQQGKSVDYQILLAQEMAHHLERKVEGILSRPTFQTLPTGKGSARLTHTWLRRSGILF